jgi:hypothetical protein
VNAELTCINVERFAVSVAIVGADLVEREVSVLRSV